MGLGASERKGFGQSSSAAFSRGFIRVIGPRVYPYIPSSSFSLGAPRDSQRALRRSELVLGDSCHSVVGGRETATMPLTCTMDQQRLPTCAVTVRGACSRLGDWSCAWPKKMQICVVLDPIFFAFSMRLWGFCY